MTSLCMTYYPISNFEFTCDKNVNTLVLDESFILIIAIGVFHFHYKNLKH